ncbi:hypothetical protein [Methylotuvimicrobium sp. KM1]|uniref:hypothetical protein n=1 Tax=Methylotuvimicrobium sp. KM1 TaxID=3377707 RepID=UPI00384AFC2B
MNADFDYAMDGVNADFAGAKICPAADTCQSSYRTLRKMGKLFTTKSLDGWIDKILQSMISDSWKSKKNNQ